MDGSAFPETGGLRKALGVDQEQLIAALSEMARSQDAGSLDHVGSARKRLRLAVQEQGHREPVDFRPVDVLVVGIAPRHFLRAGLPVFAFSGAADDDAFARHRFQEDPFVYFA